MMGDYDHIGKTVVRLVGCLFVALVVSTIAAITFLVLWILK